MTDHRRYLDDLSKRDPDDKRWLEGPRISAEDLKHGMGAVVHLRPSDLFPGTNPGLSGDLRPPAPAGTLPPKGGAQRHREARPQGATTMWFGKHKGRPLLDVREDEPGYWRWACENVDGFEAKVAKLGLLDGDPDDGVDDERDGDAMTVNR